jgi:hypothetical protein
MKIDVREKQIIIEDETCYRCGTRKGLTQHHLIPTYMKPIKNIIAPLCDKCHKELHSTDDGCLKAFLYKIGKSLDAVNGMLEKKEQIKKEFEVNSSYDKRIQTKVKLS